tara:strand:+ start:522 stop:968 length:447 start_codon:yes stop_codon:yes gene_type:complete
MGELQNIWYIKIYRNDKDFPLMEEKTIEKKCIGIGYNGVIIDMKNSSIGGKEVYMNLLNKTDRQKKHIYDVFNKFIEEMKIGDIVYLCKGEYDILYKAIISSDYYYNSESGYDGYELDRFWFHRRNITNIEECNIKSNKRRIKTLYKE